VPRRLNENRIEPSDDQTRRRHELGDELTHEFRNGLAGVRGAVQIVRDALGSCPERDILTAAIARLDRIDRQLREMLLEAMLGEDAEPVGSRSGVRRIALPPGTIKAR
jgi:nitrogen-specific signal transduction histidine kinase